MKQVKVWFGEHRIIIGVVSTLVGIMLVSLLAALNLMKGSGAPGRAQAEQTWATRRPYSDSSPWNTPAGPNPVYDRHSDEMIQTLIQTSTGGGIRSELEQHSFPVYFADDSTPRYNVPCQAAGCTLVKDGRVHHVDVLEGVPIPPGARPASGGDSR
jgi:hypothetical protein